MAIAVQVAGLTLVRVGTGSAGALEDLGYTQDGADVIDRAYHLDVPGDQNGGDHGPPIDVQYMGQIAIIRLRLTKYDKTVLQELQSRFLQGTYGTPGTPGTLMFADSKAIRLLLTNANDIINFPRVIFREPFEINRGTRFQTAILEGEAHEDATGVLHNVTTTG